jgi:asparagine synthase (glutamine-hydrolysing)
MCGIAGIISATPLNQSQRAQVRRMKTALTHRGPDGPGLYQGSHVSLAMRRLSIIDLTSGWQPLYNEDKTLCVIANGAIYNNIELRADLRSRGHSFSTGSDCEVILHLYEEYGLDCVQHLRGMFTFALWDSRQERLMLARDRMGEKPLYLHVRNGCLAFASELKSLLKAGVVPFELDRDAILHYFHYQYVPEPMTPVQGVRKLPAAHVMTVSVDPWRIHEHPYWNMEDAPAIDGDPGEIIRAQLETVAELTLRSDVPVGVALSGGLDSSAIAALAAKRYSGTLNAFSIGYEGRPRTDERAAAKAFADELELPFHEVELRTQDLVAEFPNVVGLADDPIADIASYSYYRVMQAARAAGVPVMLQGHGGDELFWGYPWVTDALRQSQRKQETQGAGIAGLLRYLRLQPPLSRSPRGLYDWATSLAGLGSSWQAWQRDRASPRDRLIFGDQGSLFRAVATSGDTLFTPEFREATGTTDVCALFTIKQPWPQLDVLFTRLICQTYLVEVGIAQGDRLSMASSVELRLPLVDFRLVETVIGLRKAQPDHALPPKAWLKAALEGVVPDWVLNQPKRSFQPPRAWAQALHSAYGSLLEGGFLVENGVLEEIAALELARAKLRLGPMHHVAFSALVLELWCRQQVQHTQEAAVTSLESAVRAQPVGTSHGPSSVTPARPAAARVSSADFSFSPTRG